MVKSKRRKYTEKTRTDAVEMYLSGPEGMREVAHALEIAVSSLNNWVQLHRAAHPEDER